MECTTLYHGSPHIIERPAYGAGNPHNDCGLGFYCTAESELAREWACPDAADGYANEYTLDTQGLSILNLSSAEYGILYWLTLLVENRVFRLATPVMREGRDWLVAHYHLDTGRYDAIVGYRADDSYFAFARAFLANGISLAQLSDAMRLGNLGEQFVLRSPEAFRHLRFVRSEQVSGVVYSAKRKARDAAARSAYMEMSATRDTGSVFLVNYPPLIEQSISGGL